MNTRIVVASSIGLNVVLGAVLLYQLTRRPDAVITAPPEQSAPPRIAPQGKMMPARILPIPLPSEGRDFQWTQIETADFQQYMANLRSIGCPEETVRDLIVGEVNKLFAPRFTALASQMRGFQYWKPGNKRGLAELRQQLEAVQKEKRELLRALLGIDRDPNEKWANLTVDAVAELGRYSFLPAEKEQQVRAIMDKYKELETSRRSGDMIGSGDSGKKLREQRHEELAQVLTPEELHELDLRDSNTADSVRSRFGSADLTEEEYRKLFALRKAYEDEQGASPDYTDPEKIRRRGEARQQLNEAYKAALGEERYAEMQRQQDPSWRGLTSVGQQYNLPQSTIDQAYQYQQLASQQMGALLSDPNIASENRRAAMKQIQDELDRQLAGLMGADAYGQFRKTSPQMYVSGAGGDTMVFSGPVPVPELPLGGNVSQRVTTTFGGDSQTDTRVTITPR